MAESHNAGPEHYCPGCIEEFKATFNDVYRAKCCMCQKECAKVDLDFLGRCEPCFRAYLAIPDTEKKPHVGVPFVPIYNGKAKYGF